MYTQNKFPSKSFLILMVMLLFSFTLVSQYIIYKQTRLIAVLDATLGSTLYWCMKNEK